VSSLAAVSFEEACAGVVCVIVTPKVLMHRGLLRAAGQRRSLAGLQCVQVLMTLYLSLRPVRSSGTASSSTACTDGCQKASELNGMILLTKLI